MAEWKQVSDREWRLDTGGFMASIWHTAHSPGEYFFSLEEAFEDYDNLQATDAEAAKREAVALFRAKLEAALKELEGL